MAVYQRSSQENAICNIHFSNCNIGTLVNGDGNTVNTCSCCRRLDYPKQRTYSTSGRTATPGITNHNGEWRGTKRKQTKIRFPQRKHRADPKFSFKSTSSDSEDTFYGPEMFPTVSGECDRGFEILMKKFHSVLNNLHPLRDSGNFKDFNSLADRFLLASKGDDAFEILILIEKSVVVSYQNNLEKAEMMVQEALDTLLKSKVKEKMFYFLVSMANLHLAGFYRRQNKHGYAHSKITIADQNSQRVNSRFLTALIFYEKASNLTKYISSVSLDRSLRRKLVEQSKDQMKQCITLCTELDGGNIYIKKHHFGLLKLALLDLNCRTRAARKQRTSINSIANAKTSLQKVQDYQNEMSEGQKIQFFVAKSDLNYRLGDLRAAQKDASQALSLAENHGFSLEITAIKERQEDMDKQITSEETMDFVPSHENARHDTLSSATLSSQRNSSCSSGCEME